MQRTMQFLVAAGVAGAVFATVVGQLVSTPALASGGMGGEVLPAEVKTGTVDVLALLEQMLDIEPYASAREAEAKGWNDQLAELEAQINGTVQALQQLDPTNPDPAVAQPLYDQYQSLSQRYNQLDRERNVQLDQVSAAQLAEAYGKIHAAVQAVAEAQGIGRVFSSRLTAEGINANNTNVVVQEVLLRPVLRDTTALDLTPLVRAELGIPEPTPEVEGPEPAPAEQPGDQPAEGDGG